MLRLWLTSMCTLFPLPSASSPPLSTLVTTTLLLLFSFLLLSSYSHFLLLSFLISSLSSLFLLFSPSSSFSPPFLYFCPLRLPTSPSPLLFSSSRSLQDVQIWFQPDLGSSGSLCAAPHSDSQEALGESHTHTHTLPLRTGAQEDSTHGPFLSLQVYNCLPMHRYGFTVHIK